MAQASDSARQQRLRSSLKGFEDRERRRGSELPATWSQAVTSEMGQAFSPPYQVPSTVISNAVLMTVCWYLLPRGWIFTLTSAIAFPIVLSSWMYSDVPATNVLASDRQRSLAALDNPKMMLRLLGAKTTVLWLFVAPFCSLLALVMGLQHHSPVTVAAAVVAICVVPVAALPLAALVGIRWPYHPLQLKYRWAHRHPMPRMLFRWSVLVIVPYFLVPALSVLMTIPALVLLIQSNEDNGHVINFVNAVGKPFGIHLRGPAHPMSTGMFVTCVALTCVVAVITWFGGRWADLWLVRRRKQDLSVWLADPTMG